MIDMYIKGTIERISPDAPVSVLRAQSQSAVPGGAANVAANIATLGAMPLLVGIIAADGGDLYNVLLDHGVTWHDGLVIAPDRQTIRKQRIMSGQQIVRVDFEDTSPVSLDIEAQLVAKDLAGVDEADTIVPSDYGKGALGAPVIRAVTQAARARGKIVNADPKNPDLTIYDGADILTPNRAELTAATGMPCETDEQADQTALVAQQAFGGDILLTRWETELSFFRPTGRRRMPRHWPARRSMCPARRTPSSARWPSPSQPGSPFPRRSASPIRPQASWWPKWAPRPPARLIAAS